MLRSEKSRATAVPLNLNNLSTNDDLLRTNHGVIMESVDHRHPGPRQSGRAEPEPYELTSAIALDRTRPPSMAWRPGGGMVAVSIGLILDTLGFKT